MLSSLEGPRPAADNGSGNPVVRRATMTLRPKILYVVTRANLGGAQRHLLWLIEAVRNTFEPLVLVGETGYLTDKLKAQNIAFDHLESLNRELSPTRDFAALVELRRALTRFSPDLIHLHSFKAAMLGRIAAKGLGIPVVVTAHGWSFTDGNPRVRRVVGRLVERALAPMTDAIIVVCQEDRTAALRMRIAPEEKLFTIPNGVPWRDSIDHAQPSLIKGLHLVNIGRICAQKDQLGLVEMMPLLPDSVTLSLVGDGPDRTRLQQQISRYGLCDRIAVEAEIPEPDEHLDRADIYVSWSQWEGLSLSLIEALRAGLPVVATNVGGNREIVNPGENGYLVAHGDREGFVSAISKLAKDPDTRARFGAASRRRFEDFFRIEYSTAKTMALYRHLLPAGKVASSDDAGHRIGSRA